MRKLVVSMTWKWFLVILCATLMVTMSLVGCSGASSEDAADVRTGDQPAAEDTPTPDVTWDSYDKARTLAVGALESRLAAEHKALYVYKDLGLTTNHFTQRAKMWGNDASLVGDIDEGWQQNPYSGDSCIRCCQTTRQGDWGGWLFLNGYLAEGEAVPQLNDGTAGGQGLDLTGAKKLRFWARGENGGEKVEFFCAGFGYNGETGVREVAYPDSTRKISLGVVTLTDEWQEYVLNLEGKDLSYIVCGFGYALNGDSGDASHVFYLDEMRYEGDIATLQTTPMMLRSYDTSKTALKNTAFSYDNALVALAFMSEGEDEEARQILDAFVYAANNDRIALSGVSEGPQGAKRMRNAYAAGDISAFPGWASGVRLPGWSEADGWTEDNYQLGCDLGSASWAAIALLQYYEQNGGDKYMDTARALMDWVIATCSDGGNGFTDGEDGGQRRLTYKSTEHNVDAFVALRELYAITDEARYQDAAKSAKSFVDSMYDEKLGLFMTGTTDDGVTPNGDAVVLDAQAWSALALADEFGPYKDALDLITSMRTDEGGYPFCQKNANGGWWAEGTAFTALMWRDRENEQSYGEAMDALVGIQLDNGLFPAATVDNLYTGMWLSGEMPWEYSRDAHIAPTAWFVMAANGFNPYAFQDS